MTQKTERDWNPVKKGDTYCSPACGAGCKTSEYESATKKADALARKCEAEIGGAWKPRVHENLGWHWSVVQDGTDIEMSYGGYLSRGDKYSVGLRGGTPIQVSVRGDFDTPRDAYEKLQSNIRAEYGIWKKLYEGMEKNRK